MPCRSIFYPDSSVLKWHVYSPFLLLLRLCVDSLYCRTGDHPQPVGIVAHRSREPGNLEKWEVYLDGYVFTLTGKMESKNTFLKLLAQMEKMQDLICKIIRVTLLNSTLGIR